MKRTKLRIQRFQHQEMMVRPRLKGKEMKALFDLRGFVSFVEECRSEYQRTHPGFIIPQLTVNSQFTADNRYTLCKKRNGRKQYLIVIECEDKA